MKWVKIAESALELQFENNLTIVEAGGKKVTIARRSGKLFAFAHRCPHAGGILAEGYVDALGNVVCPLHRYKFCLENGRNVSGEGYYLKTFPVEERTDGVYLGFKQTSWF